MSTPKDIKNLEDENQEDDKKSSGSGSGDSATGIGYTSFINYDVYVRDEDLNTDLAKMASEWIRVDLRGQGHKVEAIEKRQELSKRQSHKQALDASSPGGGGTGAEAHPELADMGGKADDIILPESEENDLSSASNNSKLQNKLKQRLAQKLGMGAGAGGMSEQAMREEHAKKHKQKIVVQNKIDAPRFKAAPTPTNKPT